MSAREPIRRLGELYGIDSSYTDFLGKRRQVPLATERALLKAMGVAVGSPREVEGSLREAEARPWRRMLAPVRVIAPPEPVEVTFTLPARLGGATIDWTLAQESGDVHEGRLTPDDLPVTQPPRWTARATAAGAWLCRPTCRTAITGCPWPCAAVLAHAARCS